MGFTLRTALAALAVFAAVIAWQNLSRAGNETVLIHITGPESKDHFATLWVVEDGRYLWIRAEQRTRLWLDPLRASPSVVLRRGTENLRYRARFFDTAEARGYVDPLFREKYGLADWLRATTSPRDSLPIRMEPL